MAKKEIQGKQVGKNVILIIEGVKYSRAFDTKEERVNVLALVEAYNTKNSAKLVKELTALMSVDKIAKKQEVAVAKEVKKKVKKVIEKEKPAEAAILTPDEQIAAAKKLLEAQGYQVDKPAPVQSSRGRSGEY